MKRIPIPNRTKGNRPTGSLTKIWDERIRRAVRNNTHKPKRFHKNPNGRRSTHIQHSKPSPIQGMTEERSRSTSAQQQTMSEDLVTHRAQ